MVICCDSCGLVGNQIKISIKMDIGKIIIDTWLNSYTYFIDTIKINRSILPVKHDGVMKCLSSTLSQKYTCMCILNPSFASVSFCDLMDCSFQAHLSIQIFKQ